MKLNIDQEVKDTLCEEPLISAICEDVKQPSGVQKVLISILTTLYRKINDARSSIMKMSTMQRHIKRWGFSFIRVKVLVVRDDSKFLCVEEKRAKVNGVFQDVKDVWNFPGGSLKDPTEDIRDAARREVMEETRHKIDLCGLLSVEQRTDEDEPYIIFVFWAKDCGLVDGEVDPDEIHSVRYLSSGDIYSLADRGKLRSAEANINALYCYATKTMATYRVTKPKTIAT